MPIIGLELGGTKLASALLGEQGEILQRDLCLLDDRNGPEVGRLMREQARSWLKAAEAEGRRVTAIGVSVPGIYHADAGTVWAPNIPGWDSYPLLDDLQQSVGGEIPVAIDSDRACSILGEASKGAARGCRNAVFLAVGTGIGAGILVDGRVLRGHQDIAGAIGWMALDRPFWSKYTACGCFEYHASGEGLARVAANCLAEDPDDRGPLRNVSRGNLTARDVFAAFEKRDPLAQKVIRNAVECWGMATANLVSLLNPEKIIFGGGLFGPAAAFIDEIREEAARWAQPISMKHVSIEVTQLGTDAALYGTGQLSLISGQRADVGSHPGSGKC